MVKILCAPRHGKNGSEAAYSLLEYAFCFEYGSAVPAIKKTPNGKPFFPGFPDVHFSLSHSATHVICAISSEPVGVDIESPRHVSERTVRYFCSQEESALFDPLDLWVLKESYIKLLGGTLPMVKTIRFSLENDKIITPDKNSVSKLYRLGDCPAAVSIFGVNLPDSIELL